jgi:tRNA-specific adenosine deaminase 1
VLHDSHAEVLAIRALNYWLINECSSAIQHEQQDSAKRPFVRRRVENKLHNASPPFEICPDIKIHMYSTCAPCGDASMELCMAEQEDSTPWVIPPPPPTKSETEEKDKQPILLDGRAYFSVLGVVRRKPSRADAERTLSKSCSDKLALRQVTSLLSYPASILIAPTSSAYITALILPEEEVSQEGCARAFGGGSTGRMKDLVGRILPPQAAASPNTQLEYSFRPFEIMSVSMETVKAKWPYGKYRSDINKTKKAGNKPSNVSAVWIASASSLTPYQVCCDAPNTEYNPRVSPQSTAVLESITAGIKQGGQLKAMTLRGASVLSRIKMWNLIHEVLAQVTGEEKLIESSTYAEFKREFSWLSSRSLALDEAKHVLSPWIPNRGDEDWCREEIIALAQEKKKRKEIRV